MLHHRRTERSPKNANKLRQCWWIALWTFSVPQRKLLCNAQTIYTHTPIRVYDCMQELQLQSFLYESRLIRTKYLLGEIEIIICACSVCLKSCGESGAAAGGNANQRAPKLLLATKSQGARSNFSTAAIVFSSTLSELFVDVFTWPCSSSGCMAVSGLSG